MARRKPQPAASTVADSRRTFWNNELLAALALIGAIILAYSRTPSLGFIWDDDFYIIYNSTLRTFSGLWRIWTELGATPQYYPLVHTSFWMEFHLWGLNAAGYHIVNLILHAAAALLLWRILRRLGIPGAWLAAALFALHPVQVESVAWITERKNVLCGVFYFASALCYLRWLDQSGRDAAKSKRNAGKILYLISLGCFLLALFSKTVACTLPVALLIVQWWRNDGRLRARDCLRLAPFFVVGLILGLITAWMERHHVRAEGAAWTLTFAQRVLIAGRALWFYSWKLLWPAKLTFMYPQWQLNTASPTQWAFPFAAVTVVAILWAARRKIGRGPLAAVLFFAITLSPALGFVDIFPFRYSYVADHFQYLACAGLFVLVGAALHARPPAIKAVLVLAVAFLTWRQTAIYQNFETLWRDTIAKNPECWMAHNNLAMILFANGDARESLAHLQIASSLKPDQFEIETNLGWVLLETGRSEEAFPHLRKAADTGALEPKIYYYLGTALYRQGRLTEAIDELERSLAVDSHYVPARSEMGVILLSQGRNQEARQQLETAVAQDPDFLSARFNLANTLIQLGQRKEAVEQLHQALTAHPDNAEAQKNMAWVLATSPDDSIRDGRRAVELAESARRTTQGRDPIVLLTLSTAYAEVGRFSDAIASAEQALELATASGNDNLAQGIRGYLTLYQYGHPFRDAR